MARVTATLLLNDQPIGDKAMMMAMEHLNIVDVQCHGREDKVLERDPRPAVLLLNFLSAPYVPTVILERFDLAVNFHPAAPEYPGVGWASRMIHDKVNRGGVTAHFMTKSYDAGPILAVRRYVVEPAWGYKALAARAYEETLALFGEVVRSLSIQWSGKAMTRAEFERHPSFEGVKA